MLRNCKYNHEKLWSFVDEWPCPKSALLRDWQWRLWGPLNPIYFIFISPLAPCSFQYFASCSFFAFSPAAFSFFCAPCSYLIRPLTPGLLSCSCSFVWNRACSLLCYYLVFNGFYSGQWTSACYSNPSRPKHANQASVMGWWNLCCASLQWYRATLCTIDLQCGPPTCIVHHGAQGRSTNIVLAAAAIHMTLQASL